MKIIHHQNHEAKCLNRELQKHDVNGGYTKLRIQKIFLYII